MESIFFREARRQDLADIVRLLGDDNLGSDRETTSGEPDPAYACAFEAISSDPHNVVYVVENNGDVAGCLQLTLIPNLSFKGSWRGQIEGVRIDKSLRGSGVGTAFFKWVIEKARQADCKIVQLTMNASRNNAHRFYQNLGFKASHTGFKLYIQE